MIKSNDEILNYVTANSTEATKDTISVTEVTSTSYFLFDLRDDKQSYTVRANFEKLSTMPKDINIPSSYDNKSVVTISASGFANILVLESVIIPNTITGIGNSAFMNCHNLKKVYINSTSVIFLGTGAFDGASAQLVIYVPKDLVVQYKSDPNWAKYKDSIQSGSDPIDPDNPPMPVIATNNGVVNTLVSTAVNSNNVSVVLNSYYYIVKDTE